MPSSRSEICNMLMEVAQPIALVLCMFSLCAVFCTAFLVPASDLEQRSLDAGVLLSLAAGICLTSGMIFRETAPNGADSVMRTLPVRMFLWAVCVMLVLFLSVMVFGDSLHLLQGFATDLTRI